MLLYLTLGILIGIVGSIAFIAFFKKNVISSGINTELSNKLNELFPEIMKQANEQLITMADQKLGAERKNIETDLSNKKTVIEDLVKGLKEELKQSGEKLEQAERDRVGSFSQLKQELAQHKMIAEKLSATTEGLKKVLSNNQLRGQFGEQVAEDLLRMTGFVTNTDYVANKKLSEAETRPDFTVFLPDGVKINVDAKFPLSNLQKLVETEDVNAKLEFKKLFEKDVKEKIKQINSRAYINPADNTVDFAIMFVPNEMVFSYIYENMHEVWEESMRQKIIITSPFSFTAVLRLIRQSYSNFKVQKNIAKIVDMIKVFEVEFKKYNDEFEEVGKRIEKVAEKFNEVSTTRTKKLMGTVEKIKLEDTTLPDTPNVIKQLD